MIYIEKSIHEDTLPRKRAYCKKCLITLDFPKTIKNKTKTVCPCCGEAMDVELDRVLYISKEIGNAMKRENFKIEPFCLYSTDGYCGADFRSNICHADFFDRIEPFDFSKLKINVEIYINEGNYLTYQYPYLFDIHFCFNDNKYDNIYNVPITEMKHVLAFFKESNIPYVFHGLKAERKRISEYVKRVEEGNQVLDGLDADDKLLIELDETQSPFKRSEYES